MGNDNSEKVIKTGISSGVQFLNYYIVIMQISLPYRDTRQKFEKSGRGFSLYFIAVVLLDSSY